MLLVAVKINAAMSVEGLNLMSVPKKYWQALEFAFKVRKT